MSSYTPGPWVYDDDTATISSERGVSIAGIDVENLDYEGNIQLIITASDLLAVVKMIEYGDPTPAVREQARKAIAKVEGRQP